MKKVKVEPFNLIGIAIRTTNQNGQAEKEIAELWGKFMNENVLGSIPGKIDHTVYSLYTDYEGDHTRPYTAMLGCRVNNLDNIPVGMTGKSFNGGNYIQTTARGDLSKGLIVNEWSKIFGLDIERKYTADFEAFGEKAQNPADAEVDFFVAVK